MGQNNLMEIGSKANVVLRFKSDTFVGGEEYKANEPYLLFKNANVLVSYSNEDKTGSAARTVIANSQINPRTVSIGSINLTKKLVSLLACLNSTEEPFSITNFETVLPEESNGDKIVLLAKPLQNEEYIFIYEEGSFAPITNFTYNEQLNAITSASFDITKNYLISYSAELTGTKFKLEKNHVPYFSLEIQGVGNIDKLKKNVVMYFDKVSLNTNIEFTFIQDQMINVPLEFHVIENKNNFIWFEQ